MNREKVLDRLRKIRSLAEDPGTSAEQSLNLLEKMQELMVKFGVEADEITSLSEEVISLESRPFQMDQWRMHLITQVSLLLGCRAAFGYASVDIIGRPLNREASLAMYRRLEKDILTVANRYGVGVNGVAWGVCVKMAQIRAGQESGSSETRALVVSSVAESTAWMDANMSVRQQDDDGTELVRDARDIVGVMVSDQVQIHEKMKGDKDV